MAGQSCGRRSCHQDSVVSCHLLPFGHRSKLHNKGKTRKMQTFNDESLTIRYELSVPNKSTEYVKATKEPCTAKEGVPSCDCDDRVGRAIVTRVTTGQFGNIKAKSREINETWKVFCGTIQ